MSRLAPLRLSRRATVLAVLVGLLASALYVLVIRDDDERTGVAYFSKAVGLYEGDSVVILGVKVGEITEVRPEPDRVRITFTYDQPVPADVQALITAPSLVPVRNLTLTPVYRGGAKLADGASIPLSRTGVPVEWDDVKRELNDLSIALGPQGADRDGALGRALTTAAANLDGNGRRISDTVGAVSEAMATLADNRGEIFGTVRNLQVFVEALKASDQEVATFGSRLADVSGVLADDKEALDKALRNANVALTEMEAFIRSNREVIAGAVTDTRPVAKLLADNRQTLATLLHVVPTGISNAYGLYDPLSGSLAASFVADNLSTPATLVCSMIQGLGGAPGMCQSVLAPLLALGRVELPGIGFSPFRRNGRSNQVTARPGPEPRAGTPEARPDLARLMTPGSAQ